MTAEEIAKQNKEALENLKNELQSCVSKQDFATFEKTVNEFIDKHKGIDLSEMKESLSEVTEKLAEIKDAMIGKNMPKTMEASVEKFLAEKEDEIKGLHKSGKFIEFTVQKDPAIVTTANATPEGTVPDIYYQQNAPAGNVNLRDVGIMRFVTENETNRPVYSYSDAIPGEGDFEAVAEGEEKPQIDLSIQTRFATPVKIAAWIKVTEEAVQDIKELRSIINNYLRKKHDLKKARLVLAGSGTNDEPEGVTTLATTFPTGTGMAGSITGNANIMQVVNAAITAIYTRHNYNDEGNYMANVVLMNPVDFTTNFVFAVDGEGRPLYPQATLFNQVILGGVTILPDEMIPSGKILVADMSKYNVFNYMPYTVKIGWVNDDFIKNQFVILAESRFHAFVKNLDRLAFIYDDISAIKTNLESGTPSA